MEVLVPEEARHCRWRRAERRVHGTADSFAYKKSSPFPASMPTWNSCRTHISTRIELMLAGLSYSERQPLLGSIFKIRI